MEKTMTKMKIVLSLAVLALGIASCGGSKPPSVSDVSEDGNVEVTTLAGEFVDLANTQFQDHYYGVGDGISTKESLAYDISLVKARNQIALDMQAKINSKFKISSLNTTNDEALETTMGRIIQEVATTLTDTRVQKRKALYNKNTGKYTVYTLVTVPQDVANKALKNQVSNDKAITDASVSKLIMDFIDAELNK
jgi:PBP1b-binding outer membrane lipoprotein LpoB